MTKQKRGLRPDEMHFVADLPIEECVRRLRALNSPQVHVLIQPITSDQIGFRAQLYERQRLRVVGSGALCRWEGTLTRVECRVQVHDGLLRWIVWTVLSLLFFLPLIPLTLFAADTPFFWPMLVGMTGLGVLWSMIFRRFAPPDDTPPDLLAMIDAALAG